MKVMHVIHGFNTGGAETLVKQYVIGINKEEFDIVVLCFEHHDESPYEKEIENSGVKIIYICDYLKFNKRKGIIFKIINYLQRYYYFKKFVRIEKPDIIHSHLKLNKFVKFAKPASNTDIYHSVHSEPIKFWKNAEDKDFQAAKWLVNKYQMRFIVLHDEMRLEVNHMFNVNNSIVLNNGIDFKKFNQALPKENVRAKLGISDDFFVIGHVGRFDKVKNHEFLVDIFLKLHQENSNVFLLLIGDGSEKEKIQLKLEKYGLSNNYMILSNRSDIPDLLNAMDIFVFPSLHEGLGISLIEAQKMKLPCFVSEIIPKAAIISNLVTKLPINDSQKWVDTILNFKGIKNVELNDSDWNIEEIIKKLEKIYKHEI